MVALGDLENSNEQNKVREWKAMKVIERLLKRACKINKIRLGIEQLLNKCKPRKIDGKLETI